MSNPIYRTTRPGEESALKQIWNDAYGGDADCADLYFQLCYQPGDGVVTEAGGTLCSAIYMIDGYTLHIPDEKPRFCTYLYALGTPEAYRGRGYGGKTIWKSGVVAYDRGADFVCFLPASPSLYRWYEGCLGTRTVFFRREFLVRSGGNPEGRVSPVTPEDYGKLREQLLAGTPHIEQPLKAIRLQAEYCRLYGGGLVKIEADGQTGIAAYDQENTELTFREFLFPGRDPRPQVQAVMASAGSHLAQVRTPVFWHPKLGKTVADNVLVPGGYTFPSTTLSPWWGFSMD